MKKVLAIGAHPDDIEFGCGGTILKHKSKGDFVVYLCMTGTQALDGVSGKILRTKEQNIQETYKASQVLKIDKLEKLNFQDLHVPFSFESVSQIDKIVNEYNIDTIYTHWAGDANQDHIATFKSTMAAARYVPNVFCYEQIPIPRLYEHHMDINYYVDITDYLEDKIKASKCHKSQIQKYSNVGFNIEENLKKLAEFRGIQVRCKYAEGFKVIKQLQ